MMLAPSPCPAPAHRARRHDALVLPADAGLALLRRRGLRTGPVAYDPVERRVQLLVPEESAEELPGLLEWLEWGGLPLELTARTGFTPREAAVWLRPPGPAHETGRIDLVRLVSAAATECHRAHIGRRRRHGHRPGPRHGPRTPQPTDAAAQPTRERPVPGQAVPGQAPAPPAADRSPGPPRAGTETQPLAFS